MQNWCALHVCGEAYWIAYYYYFISISFFFLTYVLYKGRNCFVVTFSLPLSLPFDWTFKIWSMCLLCCFVLSGCYVVMCVKKKKKVRRDKIYI